MHTEKNLMTPNCVRDFFLSNACSKEMEALANFLFATTLMSFLMILDHLIVGLEWSIGFYAGGNNPYLCGASAGAVFLTRSNFLQFKIGF